MKANPALLIATALIFSGSVFGQIEFVSVDKLTDYFQTGTGTTIAKTPGPGQSPFQMQFEIEGENINGITQPLFTEPGGSYQFATDGVNHSKLFPDGTDAWGRVFNFPVKYNATGGPPDGSNPGGLDGLFHNGTYTISSGLDNITLNLGDPGNSNADVYPNTPFAIVSTGTWAGGGNPTLIVDPTQQLILSTTTFTNYATNGFLNHIGLFVSKDGNEIFGQESFSDNSVIDPLAPETDSLTTTFLANTLTAGNYFVEMEFNVVTDLQQPSGGTFDGAIAVALFTARTHFTIQVIPEPSTYAAIFGGVALVGVMVVRRRRAMGA